jgi:hypothetical protein
MSFYNKEKKTKKESKPKKADKPTVADGGKNGK